jgi:phosphopantothenoylcysteine decarboxylase/phosphopantothenate--cysteine ligase
MRFLVTCGPTYEHLDQVRRLTNFSTGRLGIGLANHLSAAGHEVVLLKGYYAVCADRCIVQPTVFTTTEDLRARIRAAAAGTYAAVFHAAAVSDFGIGAVYRRGTSGQLEALTRGKISTREGTLLAELVPTPKIIGELRGLFTRSKIFGWKYEVDGGRAEVLELGRKQLLENRTDYSVTNGPAYGDGFGIVSANGPVEHCADHEALYRALFKLAAD